MAFLFISPLGGCVVDRVQRKKRLIGAGFTTIGLAMLSVDAVPKALCGDLQSLITTTAAATEAGSRTLFTEPKPPSNQTSSHTRFARSGFGHFSERTAF